MTTLEYVPDKGAHVHEQGAINLICRPYQSHEDGFPEWIKNASDAYARLDRSGPQRAVALLFRQPPSKTEPGLIGCLDFVGMTAANIENDFRNWADPEAATRGATSTDEITGGHGNGGKCYMTKMFGEYSVLHTVRDRKGCRYGLPGGQIVFGYVPDRKNGRNFDVADPMAELHTALQPFGLSVEDLLAQFPGVTSVRGFTLFSGRGPIGYERKIPVSSLLSSLQEHPQMIMPMQLCRVVAFVDGNAVEDGTPLSPPDIEPIPGFEQPKVFEIPETLNDPVTGGKVDTTAGGTHPSGEVVLKTCSVRMTHKKKKARHNIVFHAVSGVIGYVPVRKLDVQSAYIDQIYGDCRLKALEPCKQNDRGELAVSPLSRAVYEFVGDCVTELAKSLEARERRRHSQQEENELSRLNEALNDWKNSFLDKVAGGLFGDGPGESSPTPNPSLPQGKVARIELQLSHGRAGVGVALKPRLRFFDKGGRRVRSVPFQWVSDDTNVAWVDHEIAVINCLSFGETTISAVTMDGKVESNKVPLEVVRINHIELEPAELDLVSGSRSKITAECELPDGTIVDDVYLLWTEDNPNVARVSSAGLVYGFAPGEVRVAAGDDHHLYSDSALVRVHEAAEGAEDGKDEGKGYPRVLLSDIDADPTTGERVQLSPDHPPVYQRVPDVERNIWWINTSTPLASLYLSDEYGYKSREWRIYHIERYMDVLAQIALLSEATGEQLDAADWTTRWGDYISKLQKMAAVGLRDFIRDAELPGDNK